MSSSSRNVGERRCIKSCVGIWRSVPQACASEGIEGRRRVFDARSCAHAAVDPAEIRGVAGGRFHQGQERDPHGSGLWRAQTQFLGAAFLGPGILRQHGRARRGSHPRLHPQSREGRSEAGADEPLALTRRLGRLQIQEAASATPSAASSGSNPKAPGFAGGYLHGRGAAFAVWTASGRSGSCFGRRRAAALWRPEQVSGPAGAVGAARTALKTALAEAADRYGAAHRPLSGGPRSDCAGRSAFGNCVRASPTPESARIDRRVDKRRASYPLPQAAFKLASFLRHPGLAHVFDDPLASLHEKRIVALRARSIAPDGEAGIEGKSGLDFGSRFIEPPKLHRARQPY